MKIWVILVLLTLITPMNVFAQDVEEGHLAAIGQENAKAIPPVVVVTESQIIDFIIDTVRLKSAGQLPTQESEASVAYEDIEAYIHSEGPDAIRKYHTSVRAMMKNNIEWTKHDSMMLTINEIKMLSLHMDWKAMRSYLKSLDRYSEENFPIWTKMRVESWLVQAEIMAAIRPEDLAKTRDIEALIAKVRLAQKTNDELEYDYRLADRVLELEKGRTPEAIAEAEEAKKPFYKRWAKKLKFW